MRGTLDCGRDVTIDIDCIFEGRVTLGDDARIGAHCVIKDTTIGDGHRDRARSRTSTTRKSARAAASGRIARIRPGTVLADEVHIGNFVEVKASTFGARSKANHLSYVGDTTRRARRQHRRRHDHLQLRRRETSTAR